MFELIRKSDPYRIEQMNVYGDSLFIRQQVETLYVLGRFFEKSHKYTWQCCHILGNIFPFIFILPLITFSQLLFGCETARSGPFTSNYCNETFTS